MKAYILNDFGAIDAIKMTDRPIPELQAGELLVKMKSASLNRRDLYILHQIYPLPPVRGIVPLSDGAGEVIATGDNVTRFKIGDRVMGNYFPGWRDGSVGWDIADQLGCTQDGMLCEYAVLKESATVEVPAHLTWEEASCLPCAAVTAWSALNGPVPVKAGDTIVTIGSGGVPVFAIQIAKLLGAKVIALTSKDSKISTLKSYGADEVLNYVINPQWHELVRALTNGNGADRIIETGGSDTFLQSVSASRFGGQVVLVSSVGSAGLPSVIDLNALLTPMFVNLVTVRPVFVGSRLTFEEMNRAIAVTKLRPVIDRSFGFDEVHEAYRYFESGSQCGKVVIKISS